MPLRIVSLAGRPGRAGITLAALTLAMVAWMPGLGAQSTPAASPTPAPAAPPEGSVSGMGDINIFPKRIVLQGRDRIASVGLFNRAAAQGNYEIVLSDMMMTTAGNIVHLDSVEDEAARSRVKTASAMLRWSPRKITLLSNEAQTIRVMVRVPPDLPPGEYRTHFSAVQVPAAAMGGYSIEDAAGQGRKDGIGVRIVPRFGVTIPVIVRVGETAVQVGLRDLAVKTLDKGRKAVALTITRSGTRSAFGDITVTAPGSSKPIALIKGIGVYPEIDARPVNVPIDPEAPASAYAPGTKLTVTYTDDDFRPGEVLARQDFVVP
jgi:hypothetical protein